MADFISWSGSKSKDAVSWQKHVVGSDFFLVELTYFRTNPFLILIKCDLKKCCRVVLGEFNEWWCTRELFAHTVIESLEAKITKYSIENIAPLISNSMCNAAFGGLAGKGRFLSLYSSQGAPFTWCISANISTATQKT